MSVPTHGSAEALRTRAESHDVDGMAGEVRFVERDEAVRLRGGLEAARLLVVPLHELGIGVRGKLGEMIDEAIEAALRHRGAAPPGISATAEAGPSLSDQLYRVRQIGRVGLAIDIGPLSALVDARGALEPEDGTSLRFLAEATRDRPIVLLLNVNNAAVRLYGAPQSLSDALGLAPPISVPTSKPRPPEPRIAHGPTALSPTPRSVTPVTPTPVTPVLAATPLPPPIAPISNEPISLAEIDAESLANAVALLSEVTRATPLSGLERAFVEGYSVLRGAMLEDKLGLAGVGRAEAKSLCKTFAQTFSRAYAEALPTFGVTGRHPRMIFDVFDLAQRCARVHGARSTQVVIVDSLRFDLGKRLRHAMGRTLVRRAVCVEEHVLWSILPTTTSVQLDAIVRGEDALRAPPKLERETSIIRGRSLDVLRRTRLGHRDVMKLDLLEGRLRDGGEAERPRLDLLAHELTRTIARYIDSCPTRTLVVVVGDHGFSFDDDEVGEKQDKSEKSERSTPSAKQGGASPDEVFVPFTAWLVGGVH